jgi:hypothetical protein
MKEVKEFIRENWVLLLILFGIYTLCLIFYWNLFLFACLYVFGTACVMKWNNYYKLKIIRKAIEEMNEKVKDVVFNKETLIENFFSKIPKQIGEYWLRIDWIRDWKVGLFASVTYEDCLHFEIAGTLYEAYNKLVEWYNKNYGVVDVKAT